MPFGSESMSDTITDDSEILALLPAVTNAFRQ